jgi:hypothetical protein
VAIISPRNNPKSKTEKGKYHGSMHLQKWFITPTAPRMTLTSPTRIDADSLGENFGAAPLKGTYVELEEPLPDPEELKAEPVSPPVRLAPFGCETII